MKALTFLLFYGNAVSLTHSDPKHRQFLAQQKRNYLQLEDHTDDTDDLIEDPTLVQFDHFDDTEDIPDGLDPLQVHLSEEGMAWNEYLNNANNFVKKSQGSEQQKIDEQYAQEEEEQSYEFVQFNHEHDEDDIPDGQDPIMMMFDHEHDTDDIVVGLEQLDSEEDSKYRGRRIGSLVQDDEENPDFDSDFGGQDMVMLRYTVSHHEDDTDDIVEDLSPEEYTSKHSKQWNMAVEKQALELENQIKLEENTAQSAIKAKKDAEIHAALVAKNEAEEKHKMEEMKKHPSKPLNSLPKTVSEVDLSEMYGNIEPMDLKATDSQFD